MSAFLYTAVSCALVRAEPHPRSYVYVDGRGGLQIGAVRPTSGALVSVSYTNNTQESGWGYLSVETVAENASTPEDVLKVYRAAGFAEGTLACQGISDSYPNMFYSNFEGPPPAAIVGFIVENYLYMERMAAEAHAADAFWFSIKSTLEQLHGIAEGYAQSPCLSPQAPRGALDFDFGALAAGAYTAEDLLPSTGMNVLKLLFVQAWGDMYTIKSKFHQPEIQSRRFDPRGPIYNSRLYYPKTELPVDLRCSSLFKLLPDRSDVLFAHTTWSSFSAMGPRTFKHLSLPVLLHLSAHAPPPQPEIRQVHFSSSPGLLASLDDFYIVHSASAQLAVIETTNDVYNPELFELVTPRSCLCWARAITANTLATTAPSWATLFAKEASGTYTNQWQILDLSRFTPGQDLPVESFVIAEEIPGEVGVEDLTWFLNAEGYWASYNIPYLDQISRKSGNTAACELGRVSTPPNNDSCWDSCPRANIFRNRHGALATVADMRDLMQYNNWKVDPLSEANPSHAIASRRDLELELKDVYPSGGTDSKISSASRVISGISAASPRGGSRAVGPEVDISGISAASPRGGSRAVGPEVDVRMGPTYDQQPVFCWSTLRSNATFSHEGQPDCFHFPWVTLSPL